MVESFTLDSNEHTNNEDSDPCSEVVSGHYERTYNKGQLSQMEQIDNVKKMKKDVPQENDEEELPFACNICRNSFEEPVITSCGHYFCQKCIIRKAKCPVCKNRTGGIFNKAHKILRKTEDNTLLRVA